MCSEIWQHPLEMLQSCNDAAAAVLLGCKDALIDASLTKQTTVGRASVPRCSDPCDLRCSNYFSRHYQPRVQLFIRIYLQYLQYLISTLADVITLQLYPLGEGGSCVECWVFPCPDCPVTLAVTSHHPRCRLLLLQLETQQFGFECLKIIYFHIISSSMFKSTDS